jgi:dTDP-glucose pyrophosphorylase
MFQNLLKPLITSKTCLVLLTRLFSNRSVDHHLQGLIDAQQLEKSAKVLFKSGYGEYLMNLIYES